MAWTPQQIRTAAIAARAAGWNDEQRRMVLSSLGGRAVHQGRLTSKSPRLNQDDFEQYMATAEAECEGLLPGYTQGYWRQKASDAIQRQRRAIHQLLDQLGLSADDPRFRGWLRGLIRRATCGQASSLDELDRLNDRRAASKVIDALADKARRQRRRGRDPSPRPCDLEVDLPI